MFLGITIEEGENGGKDLFSKDLFRTCRLLFNQHLFFYAGRRCWRKAEEKITKPALGQLGQQANRHHNILPDGILVLMLLLIQ